MKFQKVRRKGTKQITSLPERCQAPGEWCGFIAGCRGAAGRYGGSPGGRDWQGDFRLSGSHYSIRLWRERRNAQFSMTR